MIGPYILISPIRPQPVFGGDVIENSTILDRHSLMLREVMYRTGTFEASVHFLMLLPVILI